MRTFLSHPINRVWARYCVLLGVMTFHLMALEASARAASQAEQGILDLRDYDFERDGPVQLPGTVADVVVDTCLTLRAA